MKILNENGKLQHKVQSLNFTTDKAQCKPEDRGEDMSQKVPPLKIKKTSTETSASTSTKQ